MIRTLKTALWCGASTVLLAALAEIGPAFAQDEGGMETVTVTAEKRSTRLQKTPSAITAVTANAIEQQHISGVQQLQFSTPSLTFGQQSGYSFISLRGVGTDTTTAGEASVATYEDGVYTGSLLSQSVPSFDLERIEVLRGPQGTLYGRNANGGVVNYITKLPSFEPGANLSLLYGSYDRKEIDAGATGPIVGDTIAGRISVHYLDRDGYRLNLFDGKHYDDNEQVSGRAALLIKPSDNFTITLRANGSRDESTNPYVLISTHSFDPLTSLSTPLGIFSQPASYFTANPGLLSANDIAALNGGSIADYYGLAQPGPLPPDPNETTDFVSPLPPYYKVTTSGYSATMDWDLGGVSLKSITAYRTGKLTFNQESAGFGTPEVQFYPLVQKAEQFTQEFNISGTAFDDRMDWLVGAFYFRERSKFATTVWLPASSDFTIAAFTLGAVPGCATAFCLVPEENFPRNFFQMFAGDPLTGVIQSGPNWPPGSGSINEGDTPETAFLGFASNQLSQSIAGFGQATYKVTDAFRVTAGLRYTFDKKDITRNVHSNLLQTLIRFGLLTPLGLDGTPRLCDEKQDDKRWYALTGTAGIDYDVDDDTLLYAKYSRGYKAGGFNAGECGQPFDPEHLSSYEAGIKSTFADGQIRTNAAFYYYDYSNIQFTLFVPNQSFIRNAGSATAYGGELEFNIRPDMLEGLELIGSLSYQHSEYGNGLFQDPAGVILAPPFGPGIQIGGNQLIRAPEWKFNIAAQYTFDAGDTGSFMLRGEAAYTDTIYNDIFNGKAPFEAATTQPSYWLLSARASWTSPDEGYEVQLFGENLTDELYATNRVAFNTPATLDSVAGQFAPPRTFGIRVSMKFGSAI